MKLVKFYQFYGTLRSTAIIILIFGFLLVAIKSFSYTFEMDYSGPGSEYESSMERYRDNENEKASERVSRDRDEGRESSKNDKEKSEQYGRDHGC